MTTRKPRPALPADLTAHYASPALRRRNVALAVGLLVFAFSLATTVFVWRYSHNQPAIPQGGSYGATYQIQQ